jgi:hypothetical protein
MSSSDALTRRGTLHYTLRREICAPTLADPTLQEVLRYCPQARVRQARRAVAAPGRPVRTHGETPVSIQDAGDRVRRKTAPQSPSLCPMRNNGGELGRKGCRKSLHGVATFEGHVEREHPAECDIVMARLLARAWSAPAPTLPPYAAVFPGTFRVQGLHGKGGAVLVGTIELTSPGNNGRGEISYI